LLHNQTVYLSMVRKLSFFLLFCLVAYRISAQADISGADFEKGWNAGLLAHTGGLGVMAEFTKQNTFKNGRIFDFDFYSLRDPKEISLGNQNYPNARPYVYGQLNSVYVLKMQIGIRHVIVNKERESGVKINYTMAGGPVIAFLKPDYYDVLSIGPDGQANVISEEFNPATMQSQDNIEGASAFSKGLNQISLLYGVGGKASLNFEWGKYPSRFYSFETGVLIDAFPEDVPIFAYIKNKPVFVNLFLSIAFGGRY